MRGNTFVIINFITMNFNYCLHCQNLSKDNIHRVHHDTIYGMHLTDDHELFGRLLLEINQAGLSWDTVLKKESNFREAYSNFNINAIANYTDQDIHRLLHDAGIIRNKLKVYAAIYNAEKLIDIQETYGSFYEWIKIQKANQINEWVKLFKSQFKFVGGEIVNEFLMSIGRIEGAHSPECYRHKEYIKKRFLWLN